MDAKGLYHLCHYLVHVCCNCTRVIRFQFSIYAYFTTHTNGAVICEKNSLGCKQTQILREEGSVTYTIPDRLPAELEFAYMYNGS